MSYLSQFNNTGTRERNVNLLIVILITLQILLELKMLEIKCQSSIIGPT